METQTGLRGQRCPPKGTPCQTLRKRTKQQETYLRHVSTPSKPREPSHRESGLPRPLRAAEVLRRRVRLRVPYQINSGQPKPDQAKSNPIKGLVRSPHHFHVRRACEASTRSKRYWAATRASEGNSTVSTGNIHVCACARRHRLTTDMNSPSATAAGVGTGDHA